MALRMGALYDALLAANVPDEVARRAAEEVANYNERISEIKSDLGIVKWMLGSLIAFTLANLWFSVNILGRLPR